MFKVAVVGCGGIGRAHASAWKSLGAEVVAFFDVNRERCVEAAEQFGALAADSLAELPADLDAVSVATTSQTHYELVKELLPKYPVFCEKPLTTDVAQGEELAELEKKTGNLLGVGFKMRFEPIFVKAKELLPQIGELIQISSSKAQMYGAPKGFWIEKSGAMCEMSIHEIDLISYLTGLRMKEIHYAKLYHNFGWEKEDGFAALAEYERGVECALQCNYNNRPRWDARDIVLTFVGKEGVLRLERPDRIVLRSDKHYVFEVDSKSCNPFAEELRHFQAALRGEIENRLTAEDANRALRMIEAIRAVAK